MRGCGERRIHLGGIAIVIVERDIVGDVVVELRRAGFCGFLGVGHGGERLDIELDGLRGIARLRQRFGDHEGHGIADKAHLSDVSAMRLVCNSGEPSRLFSGRPQVKGS